jgi:hypothetical protein
MTRTAEATGLGPTALVAVEQHFPPGQRILVDELAGQMLPFGGRGAVSGDRLALGTRRPRATGGQDLSRALGRGDMPQAPHR